MKILNKAFRYCVLVLLICNAMVVYCQLNNVEDEVVMTKKSKVLACIAITKARMANDVVNIKIF